MNYNVSFSEMDRMAKQANSKRSSVSLAQMRKQASELKNSSNSKVKKQQNLFYVPMIRQADFISEGAEQKVYRLDGTSVLKTNAGVFYECWIDYFNSLLIHNYFFQATAYTFLGFKVIDS